MNLFLPDDPRPLHFVGIAGAGMSALAGVALARGVRVSGSDRDPSSVEHLRAQGAVVHGGHDPVWVDGARAVVVSAAVGDDNPELQRARTLGLPVIRRKEALAGLVAGGRTVGVAGTHGKTTTTVMATLALEAAGQRPTALAGGFVGAWGGNARSGASEWYVVEADEYDRAFLALSPSVAVITNVDVDHLECYGSPEALEGAFVTFASRAGCVLVGTTGERTESVARTLGPRIVRFGPGAPLGWHEAQFGPEVTTATVTFPEGLSLPLRLRVPGEHNLRNAVGALGVVNAVTGGEGLAEAAHALENFTGVGRRFEVVGEVAGVTVVDDYAHHPAEISATLAALRQRFPDRRLVVVFQPHLYSRTQRLGDAMGEALAAGADLAIVTDVYAAREAPIAGVDGRLVAGAAERAGGRVRFVATLDQARDAIRETLAPGDVICTLGAGDITHLGRSLVSVLAGLQKGGPPCAV